MHFHHCHCTKLYAGTWNMLIMTGACHTCGVFCVVVATVERKVDNFKTIYNFYCWHRRQNDLIESDIWYAGK